MRGKEPVPWDSGKALDMATFEREVRGVFSQWREVGYPDEETEPSLVRAVETYEAARRRVEKLRLDLKTTYNSEEDDEQ
jgi:hypothetical protein